MKRRSRRRVYFQKVEMDEETGLYYYGARYLDPKYSRWLSGDPALSDYIPKAPIDDEAKKHNEKLPGMGGVFNVVNLHLYHYAGNNPVKYTDPDGNSGEVAQIWQESQGAGQFALVAFLGALAIGVAINPEVRQNIADLATDAYTAVSTTFNNAVDYIRGNVEHYIEAKAKARELTKEQTDKKSTGSYTIYFESGKSYSGKGGIDRACASAAFRSWANDTMPISIDWKPSANDKEAFEAEYIRIQDHGGPKSRYSDADKYNYNEIQSHGEYFYKMSHGGNEYPRTIPTKME